MKMPRGLCVLLALHCMRYPQRLRTGLRPEPGMALLQHPVLNCA